MKNKAYYDAESVYPGDAVPMLPTSPVVNAEAVLVDIPEGVEGPQNFGIEGPPNFGGKKKLYVLDFKKFLINKKINKFLGRTGKHTFGWRWWKFYALINVFLY